MATYSHESEMALFHECTLQCAQKGLDTADIVRDGLHSDSCPIRASLAAMVGRAHPGPEFKPRDASSIVEKIRTCVNVHSGYGHLEVNIIQTIDAAGKCISKHRRYVLRAHMMSRMGRFINPGIRCLVAGPQNL